MMNVYKDKNTMNIIKRLEKRYYWIKDRQWDYLYYLNRLNIVDCFQNVILGSSYMAFGIEKLEDTNLLALPSQDVYYSFEILKKYLYSAQRQKKCNRVVLGGGYYLLYHDLSKAKSETECNRIYDIYYPLLNDIHNMDEKLFENAEKRYDLLNKIYRKIINWKFKQNSVTYFSDFRKRENYATRTWGDKDRNWFELTKTDRLGAAVERVNVHEKLLKYDITCEENKSIVRNMKEYCRQRNIKFYTLCAPMTCEYRNMMSDDYLRKAKELKEFLSENSDMFIDYNGGEFGFETNDFIDSDHLSYSGALKLTYLIKKNFIDK